MNKWFYRLRLFIKSGSHTVLGRFCIGSHHPLVAIGPNFVNNSNFCLNRSYLLSFRIRSSFHKRNVRNRFCTNHCFLLGSALTLHLLANCVIYFEQILLFLLVNLLFLNPRHLLLSKPWIVRDKVFLNSKIPFL